MTICKLNNSNTLYTSVLGEISTQGSQLKIGISANQGKHTNGLLLGVAYAFEEFQKIGGRLAGPIEFIWRDDGRNPIQAKEVALEFKEMGISYVVGHLSASSALSAAEVYRKNNICYMAPGTSHPELTKAGFSTVIRMCPRDDTQGAFFAELIQKIAPASTITLLMQDNAYGRALGEAVNRYSSSRVSSKILLPCEDDQTLNFSWLSTERTNSQLSDTIFVLCGVHELTARIVHEIRSAGVRSPILVGDDALISDFIQLCKGHTDSVFVSGFHKNDNIKNKALSQQLSARFERKVGSKPSAYFETSYWALRLLLDAITLVGHNSPIDVARTIRSKSWDTTFGPINFNSRGDLQGIEWVPFKIDQGAFIVT